MLYKDLCCVYEDLEKNPSRLKKVEILSTFLKKIKNNDNQEVIYLIQGKAFPDYSEKEFGISEKLCIKALVKASGISEKEIISKWKKIGDLGLVAQDCMSKKRQDTLFSHELTIKKVLDNLKKLPSLVGIGTVDKKMSIISELLTSATGIESKYIIRTLLQDLRIGTGSGTIRDSIVIACLEQSPENSSLIQDSYDKSSDFALVFEKACKSINELKEIKLSPVRPIKVMLAQKAESIVDGFARVGTPAAFEYKYDGFRMMIHKYENKIKIYTRRQDDVTNQFPDVVLFIKENVKADSFILDSEAVGYNPLTKKYTAFQAISQRIRRKHDIDKIVKDLPVEIIVFDILFLNNESLIEEPFKKRREILKNLINEKKYSIKISEQLVTDNVKKAEDFFKKSLLEGEEGLMIKNLDSIYKPGSRVGHMLKFKPDSNELDLVITKAEYGKGKRAGSFSSFTLSCYDSDNDEYQEIGKASTGLKEKEDLGLSFTELSEKLSPFIIKEKGTEVTIRPKIVVTVKYQNIQISPTYSSGFALRFPRITRLRDEKDKPLKDIATLEEIKKNFKIQ